MPQCAPIPPWVNLPQQHCSMKLHPPRLLQLVRQGHQLRLHQTTLLHRLLHHQRLQPCGGPKKSALL